MKTEDTKVVADLVSEELSETDVMTEIPQHVNEEKESGKKSNDGNLFLSCA